MIQVLLAFQLEKITFCFFTEVYSRFAHLLKVSVSAQFSSLLRFLVYVLFLG